MPKRPASKSPSHEQLEKRLQSLLAGLEATVLGVGRRVSPLAASPSFEVLAAVDRQGIVASPERQMPLAVLDRMCRTGRHFDLPCDTEWTGRWMREREATRVMGWSLPGDRAASVFFVAVYTGGKVVGDKQRRAALEGMETLACALAPPAWMHAARAPTSSIASGAAPVLALLGEAGDEPSMDGFPSLREAVFRMERTLIRRALQQHEGNKSATARALKMSRQGLYKKLKQHGLLGP